MTCSSTRLAKSWWSTPRSATCRQPPRNKLSTKTTITITREKGEEGEHPVCIFSLDIDNGYGGKVEPNETVIAAAVRELHEESGLLVEEPAMIQRGVLLLETVADDVSPILEIHVFTVETWEGIETAYVLFSPLHPSP